MRFAEKMATDHRSVDAAFKAELHEHFDAAEVAELAMMVGMYISLGRMLVFAGGHKLACEIYVPDV